MALCAVALWLAVLSACTDDGGDHPTASRCNARTGLERSMSSLLALDPEKVDLDDLRQGVARVRAALNALVAAIEEDVAAQITAVQTGLDDIDDAVTDNSTSSDVRIRSTRIAVTQADSAVTKLVEDTRSNCP
jgi:hypothetical protein